MAQSGQLRGRVTENQLIDLLEQVSSRCRPVNLQFLNQDQMEEAQGKTTAKKSNIVVRIDLISCDQTLNFMVVSTAKRPR